MTVGSVDITPPSTEQTAAKSNTQVTVMPASQAVIMPAAAAPKPPASMLRGQSAARIALSLALIALGAFVLEGFVRALLWAGILAIATWPLYWRTQARFGAGRHNVLMPLLFTAGATLLFVVPLALAAVQAGHETEEAARWIMQAREHGVPAPGWLAHLPLAGPQAAGWWDANLAQPDGAKALLGGLDREEMLQTGRRVGEQVLHRGLLFTFTLVTLFFLYRDGDALVARMQVASRRLVGRHGEEVGRQIVASIHGTVNGMVLVGLGEGALLGIGYALARAPHPLLLGALTAVAAVIPMGAPVILAVAALLVLAAGSTGIAIGLFAVGMVIIFVADHAIRPVLIGGTTKLPFLWVLLGILGGVETFGLLGLFLGPAIMAALILLWRDWTGDAKVGAAAP
jgi:predicted PurR-regulated permease PerM